MRDWGVGLALFASSAALAQPALPPQVRADMLIGKIDVAIASGNVQEALLGIADYRRLGVKVPPALLFMEGRLAAIAKDYTRSKRALAEYLALPEARRDRNYAAALSLYLDVERAEADLAAVRAAGALETARAQCAGTLPQAASIAATRQTGAIFRECSFAPEMVIVSGGKFMMGSPAKEKGFSNEGPQHEVHVPTFAAGRYEVTFGEWDACVSAGGCKGYRPEGLWGRGRQPAINVSWEDAQSYAHWLSGVTGKRYRLLSEAEWEYAARAGTTTAYAFGATVKDVQANFNSSGGPRQVGSYSVNAFGLHDALGNVWEWTQDCWVGSYQGAPADGSARGGGDCSRRVVRGGAWPTPATWLRSAHREAYSTGFRDVSVGFRVARTLD